MPYSVSPQRKLGQLKAADIEAEVELLALHAARFGDEKCPSSWTKITKPSPTATIRMTGQLPVGQPVAANSRNADQVHTQRDTSWRAQPSSSSKSLERRTGVKIVMFQNAAASRHDFRKAQLAGQKTGHGRLVGRVEHRSGRAARARHFQPKASAGNRSRSGGSNSKCNDSAQSNFAATPSARSRIGQGVLNRQLHIGRTQLSNHRAIDEFDQRMHDRLRMNHHVDLIGSQVEQPAGFDDLQGLVHHRGRIDRDLRPHVPGGMAQRSADRDLGQLFGEYDCETARRWPSARSA